MTHDQEEALEVADRIVVMSHGKVEQIGTPQEVFDNPASAFVMTFLGHANLVNGGYVRPHEFDVAREAVDGDGGLWATVRHIVGAGGLVRLELEGEASEQLHVELAARPLPGARPAPGRAPAPAPAAPAGVPGTAGRGGPLMLTGPPRRVYRAADMSAVYRFRPSANIVIICPARGLPI